MGSSRVGMCNKRLCQGAREGAPFIANHIITVSQGAFDDFIDKSGDNKEANKKILGIS